MQDLLSPASLAKLEFLHAPTVTRIVREHICTALVWVGNLGVIGNGGLAPHTGG